MSPKSSVCCVRILPWRHQLEHGQQRHHPLRALTLAARHRAEQQRPRVAQQREDLAHPLQHRGRIGLDLPRAQPLLLLDQALERALEPVDRQILQRHVLQRRQRRSTGVRRSAPARPRARPATRPASSRARTRAAAPPAPRLRASASSSSSSGAFGIGRDQQLGLEIDERGGHDQIGAGGLEIAELDGLEVRQVLIGDGAHRAARPGRSRWCGRGAAADRAAPRRRSTRTGAARPALPLMAPASRPSRTSAMVCWATTRARREPSCRIVTITTSGFSAKRLAPLPDLRQRRQHVLEQHVLAVEAADPRRAAAGRATVSRSASGVKILCRSNTGQMSGIAGIGPPLARGVGHHRPDLLP